MSESEKKKVLVIDDVEENADIVRVKLKHEGYIIFVAMDGESGVELARTEKPDLILCDIMLPKMDGWEVLETLRKDPATADIPVIFMTAYTTIQFSGERKRAQDLGAMDYLKKPFDLSEMTALVKKYTGE